MDAGVPRVEFETHGRIASAVAKTEGIVRLQAKISEFRPRKLNFLESLGSSPTGLLGRVPPVPAGTRGNAGRLAEGACCSCALTYQVRSIGVPITSRMLTSAVFNSSGRGVQRDQRDAHTSHHRLLDRLVAAHADCLGWRE